MFGLFVEMFQPVNVVPSLMLILVLVYWGLVIIGAIGDGWFEFDLDAGEGSTPWLGAFKFLHLGDMPVMIVVSLFVALFWATTLLSNHYFNPEFRGYIMAYLLIPNVIVSVLITKALLFPAVSLYRRFAPPVQDDKAVYVGRLAVVNTSEVSEDFGQIALHTDGPPIIFNARCYGSRPRKGDVVEIVEYLPVTDTFVVRLSK